MMLNTQKQFDQQLRNDIERLRRLERKCAKERDHFAIYKYLEAVLTYCGSMEENGDFDRTGRRIAKLYNCRSHRNDPIQIIIAASSGAGAKTQSLWSVGLRRALDYREAWQGAMTLADFFLREGGVIHCENELA